MENYYNQILNLVNQINVKSTYDKHSLLQKNKSENISEDIYYFYFAFNDYYLSKENGIFIKDIQRPSKWNILNDIEIKSLISKLEVAKSFKNPVGYTEPGYLLQWKPEEGKSFWKVAIDLIDIETNENAKKTHIINLLNMADNFDPNFATDLNLDFNNYIKSLKGGNKFNLFEMKTIKTFESWDFEYQDDIVNLWLEDNNFYEDMGRWNTDSTFSVMIPDYLINSEGKLKVMFGKVKGNFEIDGGSLASLEGCPSEVGGDFEIVNTKITNLQYLPLKIDGGLKISRNMLTSLKGLEDSNIGTYVNVSENKLISLEGCPFKINGSFNCRRNKLETLDGGPIEIKGGFDCSENKLTTLYDAPRKVGGEIRLENAGQIPETEIAFYTEVKNYNNYYDDLLKWIITNNRIETDLDVIDWPESFLNNNGNIIRSTKGINKFNLGLIKDD